MELASPDRVAHVLGMMPRTPPPPPEQRDTGNPVAEACGEVLEHAADWGLDLLQTAGEAARSAGKGVAEAAGSAASAAGEAAETVASATGEAAGAVVEAIGSIAP